MGDQLSTDPTWPPRRTTTEALHDQRDFGAQWHGIWSGCLRLAVKGYPSPAQDSLPVAGPSSTGRDSNPQGSSERFPNVTILPPFPSYLAQGSFVAFLDRPKRELGFVRRD